MLKVITETAGWLVLRTAFVLACVVRALLSSLVQSVRALAAQVRREHVQGQDEEG